ncbi:MAG: hypothetical protein ABII09_04255 [Planctomycetota bacterium]
MEDKLVTIAQYMDAIEAELAKQVLEDFKIPAVVVGPNAGDLRIGAFEMVLLQVKQSDADRAKQTLESQKQSFTPEELEDLDDMDDLGGAEGPEEK